MTERYLSAYYHTFDPTKVDVVDATLEAVALAGKAYHHTGSWDEAEQYGPNGYWDLIQARAVEAAQEITSLREQLAASQAECIALQNRNAELGEQVTAWRAEWLAAENKLIAATEWRHDFAGAAEDVLIMDGNDEVGTATRGGRSGQWCWTAEGRTVAEEVNYHISAMLVWRPKAWLPLPALPSVSPNAESETKTGLIITDETK